MIAQSEIRCMPLPDKLALLEAVWSELSSDPDQVVIPDWHKEILNERMGDAGHDEAIDWELAKSQIRSIIR